MTRPTLRRAVPDTFLDAPDYNWNFDQLLDYAEGIETSVSDIEAEISGATVGIGTVIWFAKDTAPTGYLICNGSAISRTDYSDLFAKISTTFGTGDGSTTFNLPNLIGKVAYGSTTINANYLNTGNQSVDHSHPVHSISYGNITRNSAGVSADHTHSVSACGLLPCIKY